MKDPQLEKSWIRILIRIRIKSMRIRNPDLEVNACPDRKIEFSRNKLVIKKITCSEININIHASDLKLTTKRKPEERRSSMFELRLECEDDDRSSALNIRQQWAFITVCISKKRKGFKKLSYLLSYYSCMRVLPLTWNRSMKTHASCGGACCLGGAQLTHLIWTQADRSLSQKRIQGLRKI